MTNTPAPIYMTPEAFTAWRLGLGLNKRKAAVALGLARNSIFAYEFGRAPIPLKVALACQAISAARQAA